MIVTVKCESCGKSESIKSLTNGFGVYKLTSMGWVRYTLNGVHWRCAECTSRMFDRLSEETEDESQTT